MSYTTQEEFTVLHALKVRGMSTAEPLAQGTGIAQAEVQKVLDDAVARGLARSRTGGRVEGYMLTGDGRQRHVTLREQEVSAAEVEALAAAYDAFLAPNREFKQITTDWQTEANGDVQVVLPRMTALQEQLRGVLETAGAAVPRMQAYQARFDKALADFEGGNGDALAKPMSGSYHDIWMELHEDLLLTMGRERSDDDE